MGVGVPNLSFRLLHQKEPEDSLRDRIRMGLVTGDLENACEFECNCWIDHRPAAFNDFAHLECSFCSLLEFMGNLTSLSQVQT